LARAGLGWFSMDDLLAAFSGISMDDKGSVTKRFAQVVQVPENEAAFYLECCQGNIELALNMYLNQAQSRGGIVGSEVLSSSPQPIASFDGEVTGFGETLQQQSFPPGAELVFVWRFRNLGQNRWPATELALADGDVVEFAVQPFSLPQPGEYVDIVAHLKVPQTAANSRFGSAFRLRSELHGYFTEPIWVFVEVSGGMQEHDGAAAAAAAAADPEMMVD